MKAAYKLFLLLMAAVSFSGCTDPKGIFDQNTGIENRNWSYINKVSYTVKIDDPAISYNLYINLRVSGDYKYSNMFLLMHRNGPAMKASVTRYELKLANPDGEWLGKGSGNLYSCQIPFRMGYKFPGRGTYQFQIEQNMRDNPLQGVSDVGLRVEKAE